MSSVFDTTLANISTSNREYVWREKKVANGTAEEVELKNKGGSCI